MADRNGQRGAEPEAGRLATAGGPGFADTTEIRLRLPIGIGAVLAAAGSLVTCYGVIVAGSVFGISATPLDPHLQAVLMWGLALVAVAFLWRNRRHHGSLLPLGIGALAAATLIATLYLGYDPTVEALAYVLLVIAALLNQNLLLATSNRTVKEQAALIGELNEQLAERVESQDHEIDRLGRLKRFLAPQVAELVTAEGDERRLDTHRRYIACLFCDIRNFTAVSEAAEPEEVIAILQDFHDRVGELVAASGGTIGFRAGDGLMVFFNDPVPCERPVLEAVRLALAIAAAFEDIRARWRKLGHEIGLGIGIASGHATLGLVGFQGGADYTAIGGAVNTASRLCDAAADRQILISRRACVDVEDDIRVEPVGPVELKGFAKPVETCLVLGLAEAAAPDA